MSEPAELAFVTVGHPTVVGSQPEADAQDVPLAAPIVLEFSTLMDTASVEEALTITPEVTLTANWSGEVLTLTPEDRLAEGTQYTLEVGVEARDSAGTPLRAAFTLTFRAAESGLAATTLFPADDVEGIPLSTPIALVFDRPLNPDTLDADLLTIEPDVTGSLSIVESPGAAGMRESGLRVLRFRPNGPGGDRWFDHGGSHRVAIHHRCAAGNAEQSDRVPERSWRHRQPVGDEPGRHRAAPGLGRAVAHLQLRGLA
jgi:hypothetical protein